MPQLIPFGGLSLLVHISVNVLVYIYRKILGALHLSESNWLSRSIDNLKSKDGDNWARQFLSYSIASVIFIAVISNAVAISIIIINIKKTNSVSHISQKIDGVAMAAQNSTPTESANVLEYTESAPTVENLIIRKSVTGEFVSVVDFINSLGIVNSSFDNRAELAKQLGVVRDYEGYTGTVEQNQKLIKELEQSLQNQGNGRAFNYQY